MGRSGMKSIEEQFKDMVEEGLICKDGAPLKCFYCKNKELEEYQEYFEDYWGRVEFSLKCKKCQKHIATWAYGSWDM